MQLKNGNKRILKNTLLLYFRMFVMMAITLYTSRIILAELGIEDYGVYNVVGGIIVVFSFISGPLTTTTQRFINFEMGTGDFNRLRNVFSSSMAMLIVVLLVVVALGETVGLYFLNHKMSIPSDRMTAANWVYQLSILTFFINAVAIPYNSLIIAHEKMSVFAYISIVEALLKLAIALLISVVSCDKLIFYGIAMFCVGAFNRMLYRRYCIRHFKEASFSLKYVKKDCAKNVFSFSAWTILGGIRQVCHTQGIAIIVNLFFGVAVNAAQGVANQVNGVVNGFVRNFLVALNPQITQNYAAKNYERMFDLIIVGSRMAIFMVFIFVLPLVIEMPCILGVWLKEVPEYAVIFVRMILVISLIESFATIMQCSKNATGNIKYYQITLALVGLLHLPLTYVFFKQGFPPYSSMVVYIFIASALQMIRIVFVCKSIKLSQRRFYKEVVLRSCISATIASILPVVLRFNTPSKLSSSILVILSCFFSTVLSFFFCGCSSYERKKVIDYGKNIFSTYVGKRKDCKG